MSGEGLRKVEHITITAIAPEMEEAWSNLNAKVPSGYVVIVKKVDEQGGPRTLSAEGETVDKAVTRARGRIPDGATGVREKATKAPWLETIETPGFDASDARNRVTRALRYDRTLQSLTVKTKPRSGFFGTRRREGIFTAVISHPASAEYEYCAPAKVSAFAVNSPGGLSGANLKGAELSGFDLSRMDLSHADLSFAQLSRTNLGGTKLCNANLDGANLRQANLQDADLTGCSYKGAEFDYAAVNSGTKYPSGFSPFLQSVWVTGLLGSGTWDHWKGDDEPIDANIFTLVQWHDEDKAVVEIKKLLGKKPGAIHQTTDSGATALFYAVYEQKRKIADLLMQHGADPNASTANGNSPLQLAMKQGDAEIISLLKR